VTPVLHCTVDRAVTFRDVCRSIDQSKSSGTPTGASLPYKSELPYVDLMGVLHVSHRRRGAERRTRTVRGTCVYRGK
jgi:hypothetical protein